jgi:hypothetical protein
LKKRIFSVTKGMVAADKIKSCLKENPPDIRQITIESEIHLEFSEAVDNLAPMLDSILPNSPPTNTIFCDDVFKNDRVFVSVTRTDANESFRKHLSANVAIEIKAICGCAIFPISEVLHIAVESEVQRDDMHAVSPNFKDID